MSRLYPNNLGEGKNVEEVSGGSEVISSGFQVLNIIHKETKIQRAYKLVKTLAVFKLCLLDSLSCIKASFKKTI